METFLEKKPSKIDGFGIVTNKKLKKDEVFYVVPIKKVSYAPAKGLARIAGNKYVDDYKVLNFVNHSCEPNTRLDLANWKEPKLIALRDIEKDEEITLSYDDTELHFAKKDVHASRRLAGVRFI